MSTNSINELRTSVQKKTKTIDAKSDVHGAVGSLLPGETLLLSPGVYYLDKHLVVDKDVVIKSATGNPKDVTLVRPGSTTLLVPEGAPTFENLTFISMSGQGVSAADARDDVAYQSCVAVRGGAPTFVGCRATSADQSGFSARGRGVSAKLLRCEIRHTHDRGIFFDEYAVGLIEGCLFVDAGRGCVDVKMTPEEEWVEIRGSRLIRSAYANLSLRGGGRVRIVKSNVVSYNTVAAIVRDSVFEARSTKFRGQRPFDPRDADAKLSSLGYPAGVLAVNSRVKLVDSSFGNFLVGAHALDRSSSLTLERCVIKNGNKSILFEPGGTPPVLVDCKLFKEPERFIKPKAAEQMNADEFANELDLSEQILGENYDDEDDDEFTPEEWDEAMELKRQKIEKILGPAAPFVYQAAPSYHEGGEFDGYLYPNSPYGGTFVVTQELVKPDFNGPSNSSFHAFELAVATRQTIPDGFLERAAETSSLSPEADKLHQTIMRAISIASFVGYYVDSGHTIERYDTLDFPEDFFVPEIAGTCFIFDAIGTTYASSQITLKTALEYFERDFRIPPEEKDKEFERDPGEDGAFGLMLIIEITREEMDQAMTERGFNLIPRLKEAKIWPFSDLDRPPIIS